MIDVRLIGYSLYPRLEHISIFLISCWIFLDNDILIAQSMSYLNAGS